MLGIVLRFDVDVVMFRLFFVFVFLIVVVMVECLL